MARGDGFGGSGRSPDRVLRDELKRLFESRDKQIHQLANQVATHQRALTWFTDEYTGRHMSPRDHFESASKYNGIVLGVGYAGFFGLWTIVKDQGHQYPKLHAIAALLIGFSLALFVLWEVYCMFVNTVANSHPRTMGPARHRLVRWAHACHDKFEKVWPWIFGPTLIAGLGGIGCLGWILFANAARALAPSP